jgi:hypothetical protein
MAWPRLPRARGAPDPLRRPPGPGRSRLGTTPVPPRPALSPSTQAILARPLPALLRAASPLAVVASHPPEPLQSSPGLSPSSVSPRWRARLGAASCCRAQLPTSPAMASVAGEDEEELIEAATERARLNTISAKAAAKRIEQELARMSHHRLLPDEKTLEKVARYEAHLSRLSHKALHELGAMQTRRSGARR